MRIVLIGDTFPPLRTSGAVQLRDLAREFVRLGHQLTVMLPSPDIDRPWLIEEAEGVQVLRLRAPQTKDIGYLRRAIGELLMPFAMLRNLRKSPLAGEKWDGVLWYSPSIFFGPLVAALKRASGCRGYLIIRDIFPQWAAEMGLMGRGLPYRLLDTVAHYQYGLADVIGVQTASNLPFFDPWARLPGHRVEVLQNWLADTAVAGCSISLVEPLLAGCKIFVYAGNMGVAQGMGILLDLAERLRERSDLRFLLVGRGSEAKRLAIDAGQRGLDNVIFHDEIDPDEIPGLYAQCHVGLIVLDPRHRSHNIPGKFLTYMQAGLPVLASVNAGTDLAGLIRSEDVGTVSEDGSVETLERLCLDMLERLDADPAAEERCRALYSTSFRPEVAVRQIVSGFTDRDDFVAKIRRIR